MRTPAEVQADFEQAGLTPTAAAKDTVIAVTTGDAGPAAPAGADNPGPVPMLGPSWLPWNWPGAAFNAATKAALSGTRSLFLETAAVGLGLVLLGVGVARTVGAGRIVRREVDRNREYAEKGASTAAGALL